MTNRGNNACQAFDPTLYLVINPDQCVSANPVSTALLAALGGVTAIQLRNKSAMSDCAFEKLVRSVITELAHLSTPIIVNDDIETARRTGADGIHLGQSDAPVAQARKLLGESAIVGITIRSLEDIANTPIEAVDYVSIGGVFSTRSKHDAGTPIGVSALCELVSHVRELNEDMPVIAISGINASNIDQVLETGVSGIAVVSAVCQADCPERAARELREHIDNFRTGKGALQ